MVGGLGVTARASPAIARGRAHPEFPSLVEPGYPEIEPDAMIGILAPPGLPQERLETLAAGFRRAVASGRFLAAAKPAGASGRPLDSAEFLKASTGPFAPPKGMEPLLEPAGGR